MQMVDPLPPELYSLVNHFIWSTEGSLHMNGKGFNPLHCVAFGV